MANLKVSLTPAVGRLNIVTKRLVSSSMLGGYKSVFKGRGLEFASYREYSENDDASSIDWKASMRTNSVLIKNFVEERNLNVFFLIDTSSSMVFGSQDMLKNEYAAELSATLASMALQSGDSVGYAFFSDNMGEKSVPMKGTQQFYKLSKTIVNSKIYGGNFDLGKALKFLLTYLSEQSIVIIISDFIGLKKDWEKYLRIISRKFDVIGMMVRDPRDKYLPNAKGNVIFQDPFSQDQVLVNVAEIREKYNSYCQKQEKALKAAFLNAKADFLSLSTDQPFIKPLGDFFIRRERMMQ